MVHFGHSRQVVQLAFAIYNFRRKSEKLEKKWPIDWNVPYYSIAFQYLRYPALINSVPRGGRVECLCSQKETNARLQAVA